MVRFTNFCLPQQFPRFPRRARYAPVLPVYRGPRTSTRITDWRSILFILLILLISIIIIWRHFDEVSKLFGPISEDKMPKYMKNSYDLDLVFLTASTPPHA